VDADFMLLERRGCHIHAVSAGGKMLPSGWLADVTRQLEAVQARGIPRCALVLWLLITVVLIGVALALSG
jgi:hypothetical protein